MKRVVTLFAAAAAMLISGLAQASGELFIYNWTEYTPPELIAKFEKETGIKVSVDTYDSNETLLAKLQAGATGYDIVVPSQNFVPIMINEGLIQKVGVHSLPNYKNLEDRWKKPEWDPEQEYTGPWQWGTTSFSYNSELYSGKGESLKEFFEPSGELNGRLSVFQTPDEVISLANIYLGIPFCSEDAKQMKMVQDMLVKQKESVVAYNSETMSDLLTSGEAMMTNHWSGFSRLGRLTGAPIVYAYPKEGVVGWYDSMVVPTSAKNVENAKKFMNFMMDPVNMAMLTENQGYGDAVKGTAAYYSDELKSAPEINPPSDLKVFFAPTCSPKAQSLIDKVWTKVMQ
ncbi:MAG: extracellular solute-binding protein [Gammaproteobacteria bacterium]|nr:extracellular solute-binding protein [Gammaproteobacteria bacterium]MDH3858072.1 extracellular solute-binding protein [Gammaproteobacteria bacterium]